MWTINRLIVQVVFRCRVAPTSNRQVFEMPTRTKPLCGGRVRVLLSGSVEVS
jgi:hypothetical protein